MKPQIILLSAVVSWDSGVGFGAKADVKIAIASLVSKIGQDSALYVNKTHTKIEDNRTSGNIFFLVSNLARRITIPPRSVKSAGRSNCGNSQTQKSKNRFFEARTAATPPLPFILHQVAAPTCATSLQKMKTIGPVVIETASLEIRGSGQSSPHTHK